MIRKGASVAVFIYGSLLLIYIREIWKKAILDPFMTKGAINRKETTVNQIGLRYSIFMDILSLSYSF